jgi:purine-nucleoside phosphorylase
MWLIMDSFPQTTSQLFNCLQISSEYIKSHLPSAEISIVLGSGLSEFYKRLENPKKIPFSSIPYLPVATVKGHSSILYHGYVNSIPVYCWGGRLHGYEGYSNFQISYIAFLSAFLNCHTLLVTNASGSSIPGSKPGDVILVNDRINHFCKNPLDSYLHTCFRDLHCSLDFDREMIELAKSLLPSDGKFKCHEGTYFWVRGPCFETGYEVECYTKLGGNLYGMSTIPEVMAAQACGMRMLVTAVVSNLAAGLFEGELTHDMVNENIKMVQGDVEDFFVRIISNLPPFQGKVLNQWNLDLCQNSLNRERIEFDERDVREAVEFIKKLEKGRKTISLLVVANNSQVPDMKNLRRVLLSDVPKMILTSHASRLAELFIGDRNGLRVAIVLTKSLEGLNLYESYFLASVFDSLRVTNLHYVFPAFTEERFSGIEDFVSFRLHGRACWPKFSPSSIQKTGENFVLAFAGPTFPSSAEVKMAALVGFVPTIANMAVLSAASCLGLNHSGSFYGSEHLLSLAEQDLDWVLELTFGGLERSYLPELRGNMHTPSSPEQLEELSESLQKYSLKTCFVVTKASVSKYFKVIETLHFDKLPFQLHITEEKVLIIEGSAILLHEANHLEMMFPYFLANLLEIKTWVVLDEYFPVKSTEDWLRVTKHCGLAFFNPLFGKNIDKWGMRFPDMSNCYTFDPGFNEKLAGAGVSVQEGGVVFTSSEKPLVGKGIMKFAEFFGSVGIVQDGVYPVIISQHRLENSQPKQLVYYAYPGMAEEHKIQYFSGLVKDLN